MTKQERLQEIYADLRSRGIVRNKKDLAQMLGVNYGGFVEAMKGSNTARLTDKLMAKVESLYADPNLESRRLSRSSGEDGQEWSPSLPEAAPEAFSPAIEAILADLRQTIKSQQETIALQAKMLERLTRGLQADSKKNVG